MSDKIKYAILVMPEKDAEGESICRQIDLQFGLSLQKGDFILDENEPYIVSKKIYVLPNKQVQIELKKHEI